MHEIQKALKAPKGQTNSFGGYQYRSCEDIVEAVKPILHERGFYLNITDEIVMIGDRYYIKATARILMSANESGASVCIGESTAYAREALNKKGMDESQITGAASSYARKYALNGLFAIDDTKDADTDDYAKKVKRGETIKKDAKPAKEWYNDFNDHKDTMISKLKSGESTTEDIIKNLRNAYMVSKEVCEKIRSLGEGNEQT